MKVKNFIFSTFLQSVENETLGVNFINVSRAAYMCLQFEFVIFGKKKLAQKLFLKCW